MDIKNCPKCNAENPIGANYCRKCRYEFPDETKDGRSLKPSISSFYITEEQYVVGSTIHLYWKCENYTGLTLSDEDVTVYDDCELLVEKAIKLNLVATNDYDQTTKTIAVKPLPLPNIRKYRSNFSNIRSGQAVKLSWHVEHSSKIELITNDFTIEVRPIDSREIRFSETQDVILRVYSYDPKVYEDRLCHIDVLSEVEIIAAYAAPEFVVESRPVKLKWEIKNADSVMLYPQNIDVSGQSEIEVFPRRTTTYRLFASNRISQKEVSISVGVQPLPQINANLISDLESIKLPEINAVNLTADSSLGRIFEWMLSSNEQKIENRLMRYSIFRKAKSLLKLK